MYKRIIVMSKNIIDIGERKAIIIFTEVTPSFPHRQESFTIRKFYD